MTKLQDWQLKSVKKKLLVISFQYKQATQQKMELVGWYIARNIALWFMSKSKIHLKLDANKLKIYTLP